MVRGKNNLFGFMPASLLLLKLLASIFQAWSVLSVPKFVKNHCSLAEFIPKHSFPNQYLTEHFLKNSPFHKHCEFAS